jgi:ABC-type transport system substrate-binding protein
VTEIGRKTAFPVADDWQRAGVAVDLVMPPPQRSRDREFRATYPSFELARGPNELEGIRRYHSSNNPVAENNYVGTNRTRYANPDLDRLIDAYYGAIPHPERVALLGQIIHHLTANLVALPLFPDAESGLVSNRLQNVMGAGGSATQAWNAHEWDLQ